MKKEIKDTIKATAIVAWAFISLGLILIGADTEPTTVDGRFEPFSLTFILGIASAALCIPYIKSLLDEDQARKNESPYHTSDKGLTNK